MRRRSCSPSPIPVGNCFSASASVFWLSSGFSLILFNALNAKEHFEKPSVFKLVESGQEFSPQLSILSSLVMTGALLALSTHEFRTADY